MTIRLDDIDYFLAVADHGQVRRAAAALGVSQPAVTKGVRRLEAQLGFALFTRSVGGMALTRVAEPFRDRARALRAGIGDAIREASDLHLGLAGLLRVGVSPFYAQPLFVPACLQLRRQRPATRLSVMVHLNDVLVAALRRGALDLAISALPSVVPDDLAATPLMSDDLHVVVRNGHPLLGRRRLRANDLADAEWLLPGPDVYARRALDVRLADVGLPPPRVAIEVDSSAYQLGTLIARSDLLTLMSASMMAGPLGRGLAILPLAVGRFERTVGVVVTRDAPLPPLGERLVELLQATARRA